MKLPLLILSVCALLAGPAAAGDTPPAHKPATPAEKPATPPRPPHAPVPAAKPPKKAAAKAKKSAPAKKPFDFAGAERAITLLCEELEKDKENMLAQTAAGNLRLALTPLNRMRVIATHPIPV